MDEMDDWRAAAVEAHDHTIPELEERAEKAEAERDAAGAALCAAMPLVPGAKPKDRTLADLVAQIIVDLGNLRGAMAAQDERERMAGERCDVSAVVHGCDWPDEVADAVVDLRRQLASAEARYRDALAVLRWARVTTIGFGGAPMLGVATGASWDHGALAAYERIRPDMEDLP